MAVNMTIEARHTDHPIRTLRFAVVSSIELLLRKLCDEQAQALDLFGIQNAIEKPVEVIDRNDLSLRYIAEIWPRRQEDGWRKLRQKIVWENGVGGKKAEERQRFYFRFAEQHGTPRMVRVWQG